VNGQGLATRYTWRNRVGKILTPWHGGTHYQPKAGAPTQRYGFTRWIGYAVGLRPGAATADNRKAVAS
jgi:hypothetical protein